MECTRCRQKMMAETVITLRRGIFGMRETRRQGGYCVSCRHGVVLDNDASFPPAPSRRLRAGAARSLLSALHLPSRDHAGVCVST